MKCDEDGMGDATGMAMLHIDGKLLGKGNRKLVRIGTFPMRSPGVRYGVLE
jgi:hypothetical protein